MSELNDDLGYDFAADFLGNLGPRWAVGVFPPSEETGGGFVFTCSLADADEFVRCAEGLARLSDEPWSEGAGPGGLRLISTQAFTIPVWLAVSEHDMALATGRAVLDAAMGAVPARPAAPAADWELNADVCWRDLAQVLPEDDDEDGFRHGWAGMSPSARTSASAVLRGRELRIDIRFEELTPEDLASWLTPWLAPVRDMLEFAMEFGEILDEDPGDQ
jgi:hypothetical protein